jgi:hypothetical protein
MEPESSSPFSQVPPTSPYPEPPPFIPQTPSHFLKIHLNIKLPYSVVAAYAATTLIIREYS